MNNPPPQNPDPPRLRLWGALALIALTGWAYGPALTAGFVWDDDNHVTELTVLEDPSGMRGIWFGLRENVTPQYYPLTFTAFWLQRRLWGLDPLGYHAVNIVLHSGIVLLLWRLLFRLRLPGAWLAAAFFAVHPIQVSSVVWITELKNLLCGFFMVVSAGWFFSPEIGWPRPVGRWARDALMAASFLAALLSKTGAAVLPLLLCAALLWRNGRLEGREWRRIAGMGLMAVAAGLTTVWIEQALVWGAGPAPRYSLWERAVISILAHGHYIGRILWPLNAVFVRGRWNLHEPWVAAALIAWAGAAALLWLKRKTWGRGPGVAFLFYYFCGPAVTLVHVLYMQRYTYVADHWTYFANPVVFAAIAAGLTRAAHALQLSRAWRVALATALLLGLGLVSRHDARMFRNEETLWLTTLDRAPRSWLALNNLGILRARQGRAAEAEALFLRALDVEPGYPETHINLGMVAAERGNDEAAAERFREALRLDPSSPRAHYNLGILHARNGRWAEAADHYRAALRFHDQVSDIHFNLANALFHLDDPEAETHYRRAIELEPDRADAWENLLVLLNRQGRHEEAIRLADDLRRRGRTPGPMALLQEGLAWIGMGRPELAVPLLEAAARHARTAAAAYQALGGLAEEEGSYPEALRRYQRALRWARDRKDQRLVEDLEARIKALQEKTAPSGRSRP